LRRSDSIRNSCRARPKLRITVAQSRNYGLKRGSSFALAWPSGTEFFDAETKRQKSSLQCAKAYRDQIRKVRGRKSPQKRPIWRRIGNMRFAKAGWWCAQSTTNRSRPRICLISGFLQGIFANCCLLSENAREFTASIQSLANSFPKNRNRRLEAANRVSWLIIRAEHNLEQATLTQGSKARNPAPHFTW